MILLGQSEWVARWVVSQIDGPEGVRVPDRWYEAIGFLNKDQALAGGVVFYDYVGHDIEVMAAGQGLWLTPLNLKTIFLYPFVQLGCRRLTCHVARRNRVSRKFVTRLGFKLEGVRRAGMADGQDAMLYGMKRNDCRWIDNGKTKRTEATGSGAACPATGSGKPAGG